MSSISRVQPSSRPVHFMLLVEQRCGVGAKDVEGGCWRGSRHRRAPPTLVRQGNFCDFPEKKSRHRCDLLGGSASCMIQGASPTTPSRSHPSIPSCLIPIAHLHFQQTKQRLPRQEPGPSLKLRLLARGTGGKREATQKEVTPRSLRV